MPATRRPFLRSSKDSNLFGACPLLIRANAARRRARRLGQEASRGERVLGRSALVFSRPWRAPGGWFGEQYRLARLPGLLEAQLATLRSQVGLKGQREVLLDRLPELEAPTLVVWGERDRVLPPSQARETTARLRNGTLELVPDCGHLPQVEQPERFASALARFLDEMAR